MSPGLSRGHPAAVDENVLTSDEGGIVGSQKQRSICHIVRYAQARHRRSAARVIHPAWLDGTPRLASHNFAGRHRVADDVILRIVSRDLPGDIDHASLRGTVGDVLGTSDHT